ncbi:MAG: hypothetical protein ACPGU7_04455 [Gammaproteobacteria bacterium]
MRILFLGLGGLLLTISPAQAGELCEAQGASLSQQAAERIEPPLTDQQLTQLRALSVNMCNRQGEATGYVPPAPEGYADWFSWFMLNVNPDKAGNKRLKNLKR